MNPIRWKQHEQIPTVNVAVGGCPDKGWSVYPSVGEAYRAYYRLMDFVKSVMPEAEFDNHGDYCNGNVDLADGRRLWLTAFVLGGNEHDPPIMQMSVGVGRKACWLALPANGTPDEAVAAALKFLEPTKLIKGPSWLR